MPQELYLDFSDISGGEKNTGSPLDLAPNQAAKIRNFRTDKNNRIEIMPGVEAYKLYGSGAVNARWMVLHSWRDESDNLWFITSISTTHGAATAQTYIYYSSDGITFTDIGNPGRFTTRKRVAFCNWVDASNNHSLYATVSGTDSTGERPLKITISGGVPSPAQITGEFIRASFLVAHNGKMFAARGYQQNDLTNIYKNRVYWSATGNPEDWESYVNYVDVDLTGNNYGQITGMTVYDGEIRIGLENGFATIYNAGLSNYSVRFHRGPCGCDFYAPMVEWEGYLWIIYDRRLWRFDGNRFVNMSDNIADFLDGIQSGFASHQQVIVTSQSDWDRGTTLTNLDTSTYPGSIRLDKTGGTFDSQISAAASVTGRWLGGVTSSASKIYYSLGKRYIDSDADRQIRKCDYDGSNIATVADHTLVGAPMGLYFQRFTNSGSYLVVADAKDLQRRLIVIDAATPSGGQGKTLNMVDTYGLPIAQSKSVVATIDSASLVTYNLALQAPYIVKLKVGTTLGGVATWRMAGSWPTSIGASGSALSFPSDLALGGNEIYVVDRCSNRVVVYGTDGTYQRTWGKLGDGLGEFNNPTGVLYATANSASFVYVADRDNTRVQIFDVDGNFLFNLSGTTLTNDTFQFGLDAMGTNSDRIYLPLRDSDNNFKIDYFSAASGFVEAGGTDASYESQVLKVSNLLWWDMFQANHYTPTAASLDYYYRVATGTTGCLATAYIHVSPGSQFAATTGDQYYQVRANFQHTTPITTPRIDEWSVRSVTGRSFEIVPAMAVHDDKLWLSVYNENEWYDPDSAPLANNTLLVLDKNGAWFLGGKNLDIDDYHESLRISSLTSIGGKLYGVSGIDKGITGNDDGLAFCYHLDSGTNWRFRKQGDSSDNDIQATIETRRAYGLYGNDEHLLYRKLFHRFYIVADPAMANVKIDYSIDGGDYVNLGEISLFTNDGGPVTRYLNFPAGTRGRTIQLRILVDTDQYIRIHRMFVKTWLISKAFKENYDEIPDQPEEDALAISVTQDDEPAGL